jgi:rubrerythrin
MKKFVKKAKEWICEVCGGWYTGKSCPCGGKG